MFQLTTSHLKLTAIVAMDPARVIGRDGSLPWHLPADLAFFKRTTTGHPVLMGRKTFDSIGRLLPQRQNIVLTRDPAWCRDGVEVIHAPADLATLPLIDPHVFIIGGAEIYQAFLPMLDEILVSHVREHHPGDAWFPAFEHWFPLRELLESHPAFEVWRYGRITP